MDIRIKAGALMGTAYVPPSKSYAHRMLICSALAEGSSTVKMINESEDIKATLACIRAVGAQAELTDVDKEYAEAAVREHVKTQGLTSVGPVVGLSALKNAHIKGTDGSGTEVPVYPCNESGSTLRFFIPIALALTGGGIFTGSERLLERGITIYEEVFAGRGITIEKGEGITIKGELPSGIYKVRGDVSSQFVSGLLFALPLLEGNSIIELIPPVESRPYIDMTIDALSAFGIKIEEFRENAFRIQGGQKYTPQELRVEGDWSAAAFLFAFNDGGSSINVQGLNENSRQGDRVGKDFLWNLRDAGTLSDISNCPDLGPVLFAAAALRRGGRFTGIRRLRIKESDRAAAMAEELAKIGVDMTVGENDAVIMPSMLHTPSVPLSGHNDHRIVMALTVLLSVTGGVIEGAEAVRKSWPEFFDDMQKLGLDMEVIG